MTYNVFKFFENVTFENNVSKRFLPLATLGLCGNPEHSFVSSVEMVVMETFIYNFSSELQVALTGRVCV